MHPSSLLILNGAQPDFGVILSRRHTRGKRSTARADAVDVFLVLPGCCSRLSTELFDFFSVVAKVADRVFRPSQVRVHEDKKQGGDVPVLRAETERDQNKGWLSCVVMAQLARWTT